MGRSNRTVSSRERGRNSRLEAIKSASHSPTRLSASSTCSLTDHSSSRQSLTSSSSFVGGKRHSNTETTKRGLKLRSASEINCNFNTSTASLSSSLTSTPIISQLKSQEKHLGCKSAPTTLTCNPEKENAGHILLPKTSSPSKTTSKEATDTREESRDEINPPLSESKDKASQVSGLTMKEISIEDWNSLSQYYSEKAESVRMSLSFVLQENQRLHEKAEKLESENEQLRSIIECICDEGRYRPWPGKSIERREKRGEKKGETDPVAHS